MTHYLRAHHDAILIGVGTAIADDPSLNCRIAGASSPQPLILDPTGRWDVHTRSKVIALAREGKGKAPWVLVRKGTRYEEKKREVLQGVGGSVVEVGGGNVRMAWRDILAVLAARGVKSVMIEGGAAVVNDLLAPGNFGLVDSVIVTIAPVWLGRGGVQVCPEERRDGERKVAVGRLGEVKWVPLGEDVVLCGRPN
jgi:2,5-diamino-6-(ribosylamino)-4(3H)-pyrimidinone 5'-phosphate reductase